MTGQVLASTVMAMPQTDDERLELAVRDHARLVYRVAYSVVRNHHDAEDVVQETFLRVFRHRGKLSGVVTLHTWLARIAWRLALDHKRKMPSPDAGNVDDIAERLRSSTANPAETLLESEMSELLEKLISGLPEKLRAPLTLSTLEELSPAEIAEVLGISEAAVRSRVFRARQLLKDRLGALLEGIHAS